MKLSLHHKEIIRGNIFSYVSLTNVLLSYSVARDDVRMDGVGQHLKYWLILVSVLPTWLRARPMGGKQVGEDLSEVSLDPLACCEQCAPAKFKGEK